MYWFILSAEYGIKVARNGFLLFIKLCSKIKFITNANNSQVVKKPLAMPWIETLRKFTRLIWSFDAFEKLLPDTKWEMTLIMQTTHNLHFYKKEYLLYRLLMQKTWFKRMQQ